MSERNNYMTTTDNNRVVTTLGAQKLKELKDLIKGSFPRVLATSQCQIVSVRTNTRLSLNAKDYVQIRVKSQSKADNTHSNTKVQLHQLVAWTHSDPSKRLVFQNAIQHSNLEISHLCHRKDCCNEDHLVAEDSLTNKSRNYCPVVVRIDHASTFEYLDICRHTIKCIPMKSHYDDAQTSVCHCKFEA